MKNNEQRIKEIFNSGIKINKRLSALYLAIKRTRKMCYQWRGNVNGFKNWAIANGFNEKTTVGLLEGEKKYQPNSCIITDLIKYNRHMEKQQKQMKNKKRQDYNTLTNHGFDDYFVSLILNTKKIKMKKSSCQEKNCELINIKHKEKTLNEKKEDIYQLVLRLDIQETRIREKIDAMSSITIEKNHLRVFGKFVNKISKQDNVFLENQYKGSFAEIKVMARIVEKGMNASKPMVENGKYDLVWDDGNNLKKVQVKYSSQTNANNNILMFSLYSKTNGRKNGYSTDDVDVFLLYSSVTDKIYLIENKENIPIRIGICIKKISHNGEKSVWHEDVEF